MSIKDRLAEFWRRPAGFLGTSFAAPLVSGLAALLIDPLDIATLTRLRAG